MKSHFRGAALAIALSTTLMATLAPAAAAFQQQQFSATGAVRNLVDQTQGDLRAAADTQHSNGKEQQRYRNAQRSLSDFDRRLTKNKWDRNKLDKAIQDLKSILDHNTLQGSSRDNLIRDLSQLRDARKAHG